MDQTKCANIEKLITIYYYWFVRPIDMSMSPIIINIIKFIKITGSLYIDIKIKYA